MHRWKILILEDNATDAELISYYLRHEIPGVSIQIADNRDRFTRLVVEFLPDVILSDNQLPDMNAEDALLLSRSLLPHVPFIMVSGTVSEEFATSIIRSGADDYILKDRTARLSVAISAAIKHREDIKAKERAQEEQRKSEQALRDMEREMMEQRLEDQKQLTRIILRAEENERHRLGMELHDNIIQLMVASKIYLEQVAKKQPELCSQPIAIIEKAISEIRLLSHVYVVPAEHKNISAGLEALLKTYREMNGIEVDFIFNAEDLNLDNELSLNVYRIIQEQLTNINKHAKASHVTIQLETSGTELCLLIQDNGIGFNREQKKSGIGLSNITSRVNTFNGTCRITTAPGKGCRLEIRIPFMQNTIVPREDKQ